MSEAFSVDVLVGPDAWRGREQALAEALSAAATSENARGTVSLLLGDDAAIAALNAEFRGKTSPTNVLSFPPSQPSEAGFLGDIALAAETIAREAAEQGKTFEAHAAHLVVHGFLHLLGYDHLNDADAEKMEARERGILAGLGIADPYA
ncbi:MAG: rRNA maturation RNase YbeY [Hyphomonadaceae bacterium]|nr:rRNA maturation RNase YbeY [Hyphomonadaceae bacterium]